MCIFSKIMRSLSPLNCLPCGCNSLRRYSAGGALNYHHQFILTAKNEKTSRIRYSRLLATKSDGTKSGGNDPNTLILLAILREHAKQIEPFKENMNEQTSHWSVHEAPSLNEFEGPDELSYWQKHSSAAKESSLFDGLNKDLALGKKKRVPAEDSLDVVAWNDSKRHIFADVPKTLEQELRQASIATVQLAFEMDMTNIKDALVFARKHGEGIEYLQQPQRKSLKQPILAMNTYLDLPPKEQTTQQRVPLNFNALIQGTVEIDSPRITADQLSAIKVPEFNDYVTSLAAHICSTALQKGFASDLGRMFYSTAAGSKKGDSGGDKPRSPHIVCVRKGDKGCVSPGNADNPKYESKGTPTSASATPTSASGGQLPFQLKFLENGLLECKAYAKAKEAAEKQRELAKEKCGAVKKASGGGCKDKKGPCKEKGKNCPKKPEKQKCPPPKPCKLDDPCKPEEPPCKPPSKPEKKCDGPCKNGEPCKK